MELDAAIRREIAARGPVTFERFMEMALYEPSLGYYASASAEIGCAGDFYTSPHLHPIFGAMIGRQVQECWEAMGRPEHFDIVEAGAGRGYLCHDTLKYLQGREIFDALTYAIVELNPTMASRQRELLGPLGAKVRWAASIRELGGIRGAVISNELIDAFPVHAVTWREGGLREIHVTVEDGRLTEVELPPSTPRLTEHLDEFGITLPEGYRTEINLRAKGWLGEVSEALTEGFVLTIDYGHTGRAYYDEERSRGTLMCYHEHQINEDPYINIGRQDITSHVDFSALARWGRALELRTLGYTRQGLYLLSLGLDEAIIELYGGSPDYQTEAAKVLGLVMPGAMGDSHKVLLQARGIGAEAAFRGFKLRNLAASLD